MALFRWGCAGQNNVYLFAHAGGPFKRLHDLYVRGGLRRGMTVTYADANGKVHHYRVAWWKVVLPTNGDFAFAAQPRPSMTLQTCVGLHDRYRLVVRLYQSD
jgi:sortase (surface protein transpeptidase)